MNERLNRRTNNMEEQISDTTRDKYRIWNSTSSSDYPRRDQYTPRSLFASYALDYLSLLLLAALGSIFSFAVEYPQTLFRLDDPC